MSHFLARGVIALTAAVALTALGLALWVIVLPRLEAAPGSLARNAPAQVNPDSGRNCYNWDFLNNTGQDLNDLHVSLRQLASIGSVYTGTFNVFGAPDNTSGFDPNTGVYNLNYSGGTVYASDGMHLGLCTDSYSLRLNQSSAPSPFYWTANQARTTPDPLFIGVELNWIASNHLRIHLDNEQNITMTLMALNFLDAGNALTLDDLNGSVVDTLPMVNDLAPDPLILSPRGDSFFDVFFDAVNLPSRDHPYVLEAIVADADDSGNLVHLYVQGLAPPLGQFMPVINK